MNFQLKTVHFPDLARLFCWAAAALLGWGCGGGDGDAPQPLTYSGIESQAVIADHNALAIAVDVLRAGQTGSSLNVYGLAQSRTGGGISLFRLLDLLLAQTPPAVHAAPEKPGVLRGAAVTNSGPLRGECGGGGSFSATLDQDTGEYTQTTNYDHLCFRTPSGDVTLSGSVQNTGRLDVNTSEVQRARLSFSFFTVRWESGSLSASGEMAVESIGSTFITTLNMLMRTDSAGTVYRFENFSFTVTSEGDFEALRVSGTFYHPDYGFVIVSTPDPLQFRTNAYDDPSSGTLHYEGSGGTKMRFTALSSLTFQISVDTDGDGELDLDSRELSWLDINLHSGGAALLGVDAANAGCDGLDPCYASIQEAIDASNDGDTILVFPGTYPENVSIRNKALRVGSLNGPESTVIDGGENGSTVSLGESARAIIEGFTIRGGGGASNLVESGYGVVVTPFTQAAVIIRHNTITKNNLRGGVGVVRGGYLEVSIYNNRIVENFRGIHADLGTVGDEIGFVKIMNNVIAFNHADPGDPAGGGLKFIACCPFSDPARFKLEFHVVNNTIYGNTASAGGGLAANASNLNIVNNIFYGNEAESAGQDLYLIQAGQSAKVSHNLFGGGQQAGSNGNISGDPLLVSPDEGDFRLQPGSPAIDGGSNDEAPSDDFDGVQRPLDGNEDETATVDLGAFEFSP